MFKNMVKRSWLSIVRKPMRAILIGLILFAMANLVLASVAIKGAVANSVSYAKSSLGGTVYLQPDTSKLRQQLQSQGGNFTPGQRPKLTRPKIAVSMVKSIADSDYVKDYSYSLMTQAKASGFTAITSDSSNMGGRFGFGSDSSSSTELQADMMVSSANSYSSIDAVKNKTLKITSGVAFDDTTTGQVIISDTLATSNKLTIGDTIKLQNINDSKSYSLKVVGTYSMTTDESSFGGNSDNTIYTNIPTATQFLSTSDYNKGDFDVQGVQFDLTDAEHSDAFIAAAKAKYPNLSSDNLTLSIDTSAYDQMVGPIESVGSFATTIFWIVVIASVAIITLIVTINVKDRRYEMGVLLSLGASKTNVVAQVLVELLVVGTIAFAVSVGTGTVLAKTMSQGLLDHQIAMSKESDTTMMGGGRFGGGFKRNQSQVQAIDSINVNPSAFDYALLFLIGYGVVVLSLLIPAWNIVKYQPKTILAGKE